MSLEEEGKVLTLHEALSECDRVTRDMNAVLGGLEAKLRTLQSTLRPLQTATREVALAETNINRAMDEMQKVIEHHRLSQETSESAKKRELRLFEEESFLIWCDRLIQGKTFLEMNGLSVDKLSALGIVALDKMETHMREVLSGLRSTARRSEDKCVALAISADLLSVNSPLPTSIGAVMADDSHEEAAVVLCKHKERPLWDWTSATTSSVQVFRNASSLRSLIASESFSESELESFNLKNSDFALFVSDSVMTSLCNVFQKIENTAQVFEVPDNVCHLLATGRSIILAEIVQSHLSDDCLSALLYAAEWCSLHQSTEDALAYGGPVPAESSDGLTSVGGSSSSSSSEAPLPTPRLKPVIKKTALLSSLKRKRRSLTEESDALEEKKYPDTDDGYGDHFRDEDIVATEIGTRETLDMFGDAADSGQLNIVVRHHALVLLTKLFATLATMEHSICQSILKHTEKVESEEVLNSVMADVLLPALKSLDSRISQYLAATRSDEAAAESHAHHLRQRTSVHLKRTSPLRVLTSKLAEKCEECAELSACDAVLVRVDLVYWLRRVTPLIEAVTGDYLEEWSSLLRKVETDCARSLEDKVAYVGEHNTKETRNDGGTHPLTIDCAALMQAVVDNDKVCGGYRAICDSLYPMADASDYLLALRTALVGNLKEKAKHYPSKHAVLQCVFELNNLDYLSKCECFEECAPRSEVESLRKQVISLRKKYLNLCWDSVASLLILKDKAKAKTTAVTTSATERLPKRERNSLKTRWNSVNQELSVALSRHYVIPDPVLRTDMCTMTVEFVLPLYQDFWRKYFDVDFTEHKEKYFKMDPKMLERKINAVFFGRDNRFADK